MDNNNNMIRLTSVYGGFCVARVDNLDDDIFVQSDWDFPGLASTFGWVACDCRETDGTVDCEHRTASEMISEAHDYLQDHDGDEVEDPGYF